MRMLPFIGLGIALALGSSIPTGGAQAGLCPAINGQAAGCDEVITFGPLGAISTSTTIGPYDGADDTSVGVINNSGAPISSFQISSALQIFGFDGDGIDNFAGDGITGNATDAANEGIFVGRSPTSPYTGCYGGPNGFFTNINAAGTSGTVNFITAIPDGGSDYFSLEQAVQLTAGQINPLAGVPEPATFVLLGVGLLGLGVVRARR